MNKLPSLYSDDDDDGHDDNISQAIAPRGINPWLSSARHNHRFVVDSSESEDDQGRAQLCKHNNKHLSRQPRTTNCDITSLLRMMQINLNQRVDVGAGAGRSQLAINHNRRPVLDYSDMSTDDEGPSVNHYKKIIKHFGDPHPLNKYNFSSETNCKVCGLQIDRSGYGCQGCQFYLHTSCLDLPQKIQHDAHAAHPLTLCYPSSYYGYYTCAACSEYIQQSFYYQCDRFLCSFTLHVTCAALYSLVKRADTSKDTLRLYYTFPVGANMVARCNVCNKKVSKEGWVYYSKDTGYIAHINCAKCAKVGPSWIKERLNMIKTE